MSKFQAVILQLNPQVIARFILKSINNDKNDKIACDGATLCKVETNYGILIQAVGYYDKIITKADLSKLAKKSDSTIVIELDKLE